MGAGWPGSSSLRLLIMQKGRSAHGPNDPPFLPQGRLTLAGRLFLSISEGDLKSYLKVTAPRQDFKSEHYRPRMPERFNNQYTATAAPSTIAIAHTNPELWFRGSS